MNLDKAYAILTETKKQQERVRLRQTGTNNSSTSNTISGQVNYQNDRAIPEGEEIVMGTDRRVFNVQCNRCNAWGQ